MPRGRLAKLSDADLAEYALKYHIDAFRRSKRSGINQVHHVQWGWMTMKEYYRLQKLHEFPWEKVIEAGYRLKQALWTVSIDIGPVSIQPLAATYLSDMYFSWVTGNGHNVLKMALFAALPFGDIIYLMRWAEFVARGGTDDLQGTLFLDNILDPILKPIAQALGFPTTPPEPELTLYQ